MDEPTNDLDIETLELLEDLLVEYPGTLLLVSHDREFLNNVVTSTLVLEGDGRVKEYAGGYDDWLRQRSTPGTSTVPLESVARPSERSLAQPQLRSAPRKLSFKEQRELEMLPARIEQLEIEQAALHAAMSAPSFYQQPKSDIAAASAKLEALERELGEIFARWESLEADRSSSSPSGGVF